MRKKRGGGEADANKLWLVFIYTITQMNKSMSKQKTTTTTTRKKSLTHYNESKGNRTEEIHRNNKVTCIKQNAVLSWLSCSTMKCFFFFLLSPLLAAYYYYYRNEVCFDIVSDVFRWYRIWFRSFLRFGFYGKWCVFINAQTEKKRQHDHWHKNVCMCDAVSFNFWGFSITPQ